MSVLSAASPLDYVGHEPMASEFLSAAAVQIDERLQHDAPSRWRALEEIGHGLINLGQSDRAAKVLLLALEAQAADPARTTNQQLDLLRLLMSAQDAPGSLEASVQTARSIQQLARRADADAGIALDALARAARCLSTHDELVLAEEFLQEVSTLLQQQTDLAPVYLENIERQRGLVWSRFGQLNLASAAFLRALTVIEAQPQDFSPLRRAELNFFLADVQVDLGQTRAARANLDAAWAVYQHEYPADHPETARCLQIEIALALLAGNTPRAQALLVPVRAILAVHRGSLDALRVLHLQSAAVQLALENCPASGELLAKLVATTTPSRRRRVELTRLQAQWQERCALRDASLASVTHFEQGRADHVQRLRNDLGIVDR
jgi:tetratricopeptide (TPR) repeat protein